MLGPAIIKIISVSVAKIIMNMHCDHMMHELRLNFTNGSGWLSAVECGAISFGYRYQLPY